MANALTDFTKKREFLICMDSDGCVMDTVRIKHSTVMCPELIRVFALDDHADFITAAWDEINLHTITRGISRFESVRLVFDRLKNRGIEIPGSEDIAAWVDTATELSTASLQRELQKTGSLALRKLQEWNNACNRRIQALEPTFEPFPGVQLAQAFLQLAPPAGGGPAQAAARHLQPRLPGRAPGRPEKCAARVKLRLPPSAGEVAKKRQISRRHSCDGALFMVY